MTYEAFLLAVRMARLYKILGVTYSHTQLS